MTVPTADTTTTTTITHSVTIDHLTEEQHAEVLALVRSFDPTDLTSRLAGQSTEFVQAFGWFERIAHGFALQSTGPERDRDMTLEEARWIRANVWGIAEDEVNGEYNVFQIAGGDLQHVSTADLLTAYISADHEALHDLSA